MTILRARKKKFKKQKYSDRTTEYYQGIKGLSSDFQALVKSNVKYIVDQRGITQRELFRRLHDKKMYVNRTAFYKTEKDEEIPFSIFMLTIFATELAVPVWLLLVPDIEDQFEPFR